MAGITLSGTYGSTVQLNDPLNQNPVTLIAGALIGLTNMTGINGNGAAAWTIDNSGSITVAGSGGFGIALAGGGTVVNHVGARIAASYQGVYVTNAPLTMTNAGTVLSADRGGIEARAGGTVTNDRFGLVSGFAAGIVLGATGSVINSGSIEAGNSTSSGINLAAGGFVSNASTGTIVAGFGLYSSLAAATVVNQGHITGLGEPGLLLHVGGTVTNSARGVIIGHYSAVHIENAAGSVTNAGIIASDGNGVVLEAGGLVSIAATGSVAAGSGVGVAFAAVATLVNSGRVTASANAVALTNGGVVQNKGTGFLTGYSGVFAGGLVAITNAGTILGTGNFGVRLNAGGVVTNAATGTIRSSAVGVGAFYTGATVVTAGSIVGVGAAAAVQLPGGFVNRVVLLPGARFTGRVDGGNTPGGTVASTLELAKGTGTGTLVGLGAGYIGFSNLVVDSGAAWVAGGSNAITAAMNLGGPGRLTVAGAVTNAGSIQTGIAVTAGGTLLNMVGGRVTSAAAAVTGAGGSVLNQAGGTISGAQAVSLGAAGTVVNGGWLAGSGTAVILGAGGSLLNRAGAMVVGAAAGVRITAGAAVVNNFGTISGGNNGGGKAVQFANADGNLLVVHPGAVFNGQVVGGSGQDTLELASAASVGSIAGLGSHYAGFETLLLQSGAHWRMARQNTLVGGATLALGAGGVLSVAGTLVVGGDLTLNRLGRLEVGPTGAVAIGAAPATAGAITVAAATEVSGIGALKAASIIDAGTITASGGALRLIGDISGPGAIAIDMQSIMAIYGTTGVARIAFLPGGGELLVLGNPAATSAVIDGFVATDTIDLKGIGLATSVDYLGTTLTVHQVGGGSFTLGFSDPGLAGHFAISSDGTGGTNLKFV